MDLNKFYKKIESELSRGFNLKVKIRVRQLSTTTEFIVYSKEFSDTFLHIIDTNELHLTDNDDSKFQMFILDFIGRINKTLYLTFRDEIDKITSCCDFYMSKCAKTFDIPENVQGKNLSPGSLNQLGAQVFIYRIGSHYKSLKYLTEGCNLSKFLEIEYSIGILLRSCILDSVHIMAWGKDSKIISALASESFLNNTDQLGKELKDEYLNYANYFNVDKHDRPKDEIIWKKIMYKLQDATNTVKFANQYLEYSKYDHYSLIPFIYFKSTFQKLYSIWQSMHFIKYAVCQLLSIHNIEFEKEFTEILGIYMEDDGTGVFKFKNKM